MLGRQLLEKDERARKAFRKASGLQLALLPYDLCVAYTKSGRVPLDLHVEHPRWLTPMPKKDQRFLLGGDGECLKCRRDADPICHGHLRGLKLK